MQINDTPKPPHEIMPSIPRGLEQVILKAIEKDPSARIQSAEEMLRLCKQLSADPFVVFDFNSNTAIEQVAAKSDQVQVEEEEEVVKPRKTFRQRFFKDRRSKATMTPIILAVFLAAVIVGSITALYLVLNVFSPLLDIFRPTDDVGLRVIDFTGEEASDLNIEHWRYLGFEVRLVHEPNGYYESGIVFRQDPRPTLNRRRGYVITLTVSTGPDMARMGNYIMEDHRIVQMNLVSRGFNVEIRFVDDRPGVPNGMITETIPAHGDPIAAFDNEIILYVSTGPIVQSVNVPSLDGMTRARAEQELRSRNLRLGTVTTEARAVEGVPPGTVTYQSIAANASVARNTVVNIRVNPGTPLTIPNVVGQTQEAATAAITGANLVVGTITYEYSDTVAAGSVIRQTPAGGAPHVAGASVNLVIAQARPGAEPPPPEDDNDNDNDNEAGNDTPPPVNDNDNDED